VNVAVGDEQGVLAGGGIDMPEAGTARPTFDVEVRGWAVGRRAPPVHAELSYEELLLRQVPFDVSRPKLAVRHPRTNAGDEIGFRVVNGVLRLPTEFELSVHAVTEDGQRAAIGTLGGRRAEIRTAFEPRFQPLMITTLGRTGSMMLMRMLEPHPEVLVYRPFRYEQRVASYWIEVMLALAEPASYFRQIAPVGSLDERIWWLGENGPAPGSVGDEQTVRWMGSDAVRELAELSQSRIERFYGQLAARAGNSAPAFFAEKYALEISHLVRELYPGAREVFLVRDFRDMLCSIIAFNERRGVKGFGRSAASSDREYVQQLGGWAARLERAHELRADRSVVVRYEDLVLDPAPTLSGLLEYLQLEPAPHVVETMIAALGSEPTVLADHGTAPDPRSSIGRWRDELDDELLELCEKAFGSALESFGYARAS
jgi:hypothetical protein